MELTLDDLLLSLSKKLVEARDIVELISEVETPELQFVAQDVRKRILAAENILHASYNIPELCKKCGAGVSDCATFGCLI